MNKFLDIAASFGAALAIGLAVAFFVALLYGIIVHCPVALLVIFVWAFMIWSVCRVSMKEKAKS
jgi:hypothetical protein